jgi:hypothetical protein
MSVSRTHEPRKCLNTSLMRFAFSLFCVLLIHSSPAKAQSETALYGIANDGTLWNVTGAITNKASIMVRRALFGGARNTWSHGLVYKDGWFYAGAVKTDGSGDIELIKFGFTGGDEAVLGTVSLSGTPEPALMSLGKDDSGQIWAGIRLFTGPYYVAKLNVSTLALSNQVVPSPVIHPASPSDCPAPYNALAFDLSGRLLAIVAEHEIIQFTNLSTGAWDKQHTISGATSCSGSTTGSTWDNFGAAVGLAVNPTTGDIQVNDVYGTPGLYKITLPTSSTNTKTFLGSFHKVSGSSVTMGPIAYGPNRPTCNFYQIGNTTVCL